MAPDTPQPTPDRLVGNILVTDEAGLAVYANEGIARKTGFSVAEILDSKPGKLWGGQMPRAFYDDMWRSLRTEGRPFVGTVTNHTKSGESYEELLALAPLKGKDGTAKYLALRPAQLGEGNRFLDEWKGLFGRKQVSARAVLPWLRRWFPTEVDMSAVGTESFSEWIEIHWIERLRARFQRRSDDRQLVLAAQRDPSQFQVLYEKYHPTVRKYFSRHLPGHADQIEDLVQDTFIRAFERLPGYEARNAAYGTYLLRIAHNLLLNSYRRADALELMPDFPSPTAERSVTSQLSWIWEAPELSYEERLALSAYYREGYSVREIARGFRKSENAVKLMLSRARKKIRPLLGSA